jgi:nucleoside-diphosphate-sugar epimerase
MSVKRVVYTSSSGAIAEPGSPPRVYTEENWNNVAVEVTEAKGREAPGPLKYMASKVLAEKDMCQISLIICMQH